MRDQRKGRLFGRTAGPRRALLHGLASSLVLRGKITTTEARAKELRGYLEPLVTTAAKGNLAARRKITGGLSKTAATKLWKIAPEYKERPGGYLRIIKANRRAGDAAHMAIIEFVK